MLFFHGVYSLYQAEDQKDNSGQCRKNSPWSVEIIAHKHSTPSRPSASAITNHSPAKTCVVVGHTSVNVKLVEELGCILRIQLVINYLMLTENIYILFSINEAV
jgi:hypothetical protein